MKPATFTRGTFETWRPAVMMHGARSRRGRAAGRTDLRSELADHWLSQHCVNSLTRPGLDAAAWHHDPGR